MSSGITLLKALGVLVCGALCASALAPPRPPQAGTNAVYKGQPFEYVVRFLAWLGCSTIVVASMAYAVLLVLQATRRATHPVVPYLCPASSHSLDGLSAVNLRFMIGEALVVFGAMLRLLSYRALGDLFTYEIVVKDEHRVVSTGPYAYVRHPSYSGLTALLLGTHLFFFGRGAYVTDCGIEGTPFGILVWVWRVAAPFAVVSCWRRCGIEDAQLRHRFGRAWEEYRLKVQYSLVPLVF
ncbi:hypothetical protein BN946_scf184722.g8 [Trametes cinnabarina]|uniref:Protein-S-isoprenylcysteine O-methyltransferase n=1 Tax=Pycnoporus cinnabarinus TaxID=5643 RepID=A0A060SUN4_PYCCI|nr:hypothetical protein BN946_scf184722.g8 [Trametes cinnabarina]